MRGEERGEKGSLSITMLSFMYVSWCHGGPSCVVRGSSSISEVVLKLSKFDPRTEIMAHVPFGLHGCS